MADSQLLGRIEVGRASVKELGVAGRDHEERENEKEKEDRESWRLPLDGTDQKHVAERSVPWGQTAEQKQPGPDSNSK